MRTFKKIVQVRLEGQKASYAIGIKGMLMNVTLDKIVLRFTESKGEDRFYVQKNDSF